MTGLRFDRIWASDQNWSYPTDSQTARGLSFLGTEEPTFDLHDVMFKELDLKGKWLYDQVRNACERFGQKVQSDDGSAIDGARDAMANAITNALITQRKADEGGYGIVKMANADTVRAGKEYNQAVSPAHLSEYVAEQNTWQNTRDKPQTATRWPDFSEVTGKPRLGSSSSKDVFDTGDATAIPYGYEYVPSTGAVAATRDYAKKLNDTTNSSLKKIATSGLLNDGEDVLGKPKGGTGRGDGNLDANSVYITGTSVSSAGLKFANSPASDGEANKICAGKDDNGSDIRLESSVNIDAWRGIAVRDSANGYRTTYLIDSRTGSVEQRGDISLGAGESATDKRVRCRSGALILSCDVGDFLRIGGGASLSFHNSDGTVSVKYEYGVMTKGEVPVARVTGLGSMATKNLYGGTDPSTLPDDSNQGASVAAVKNTYDHRNDGLKSAAWMSRLDDNHNNIGGSTWEVLNTKQFANYRDDARTPGQIGSYVTAKNVGNNLNLELGSIVNGSSLMPCSLAGTNESNPAARLEGGWRCAGWAGNPSSGYEDRKSTSWVRVW